MRKIFCSCCGNEAGWLSLRSLCEKCQKVKGALARRKYHIFTGKEK